MQAAFGHENQSKQSNERLDLGMNGQFLKSMHSIRSINSIKLDNYHADREKSQNNDHRGEDSAPTPTQEKHQYLKKGDKSRLYDPKKSIQNQREKVRSSQYA